MQTTIKIKVETFFTEGQSRRLTPRQRERVWRDLCGGVTRGSLFDDKGDRVGGWYVEEGQ